MAMLQTRHVYFLLRQFEKGWVTPTFLQGQGYPGETKDDKMHPS
jgi:hypothetical protein